MYLFLRVLYLFLLFIWLCRLSCRARVIHCDSRGSSLVVAHRLCSCDAQATDSMPAQLPCGTWGLSSPIRDQTSVPCIGRWILNHWTTREVLTVIFYILIGFAVTQLNAFVNPGNVCAFYCTECSTQEIDLPKLHFYLTKTPLLAHRKRIPCCGMVVQACIRKHRPDLNSCFRITKRFWSERLLLVSVNLEYRQS